MIKGDARLTYGDVKKAMLKVKEAGFEQVGLISQKQDQQRERRPTHGHGSRRRRRAQRPRSTSPRSIDVVLVLLIIFMVVVPLVAARLRHRDPEGVEGVRRAGQGQSARDPGDQRCDCAIESALATPGLPPGCKVFLNKDEVSIDQLPTRIGEIFKNRRSTDKILFLAAEEKLNYEGIIRILDIARKGDEMLKIGIVSDERLARPLELTQVTPSKGSCSGAAPAAMPDVFDGDRQQRDHDDPQDHEREVVLHDRDVAERVAGPHAGAHPDQASDDVVGGEPGVRHRADPGDERGERPDDRHEARQEDRLAAVALVEGPRADQVLSLQEAICPEKARGPIALPIE